MRCARRGEVAYSDSPVFYRNCRTFTGLVDVNRARRRAMHDAAPRRPPAALVEPPRRPAGALEAGVDHGAVLTRFVSGLSGRDARLLRRLLAGGDGAGQDRG